MTLKPVHNRILARVGGNCLNWFYFLLILLGAIVVAFLVIRWFITKTLSGYISKPGTSNSANNFPDYEEYKSDIICFKCGQEIDPAWIYCPMCGTKVIK